MLSLLLKDKTTSRDVEGAFGGVVGRRGVARDGRC